MSRIIPAEITYPKAHASDNREPEMTAIAICGLVVAYTAVSLRFSGKKQVCSSLWTWRLADCDGSGESRHPAARFPVPRDIEASTGENPPKKLEDMPNSGQ